MFIFLVNLVILVNQANLVILVNLANLCRATKCLVDHPTQLICIWIFICICQHTKKKRHSRVICWGQGYWYLNVDIWISPCHCHHYDDNKSGAIAKSSAHHNDHHHPHNHHYQWWSLIIIVFYNRTTCCQRTSSSEMQPWVEWGFSTATNAHWAFAKKMGYYELCVESWPRLPTKSWKLKVTHPGTVF